MNIIPNKYLIPSIILCILFALSILFLDLKPKYRILGTIIAIVSIILVSFILFHVYKTDRFVNQIEEKDYQTEEYYVYVLKDSSLKDVSELKEKLVGVVPSVSDSYEEAFNNLKEIVAFTEMEYNNLNTILNDFYNKKMVALFLSESQKNTIQDTEIDFSDKTRVLENVSIKSKNEVTKKAEEVTSVPFNIYISGIDIYGPITSVSRSDVNMIMSVNPNTKKILLTSIPRDYYVQLNGTNGYYRDKLTHSGVYGIDKSIKTIEDLLSIDLNYYIRINFSTLIGLVDAIGGVDINSDRSFIPHTNKSCTVNEGMNHFNGACALAYSRERYTYPEGDRHRVQNQQQVLSAILTKVMHSKTMITKYSNILDYFGNSIQTNLDKNKIYELVNLQLSSMSTWNIEGYSLDGQGKMDYTYTYPYQKLYVMEPYQNTINSAKEKINNLFNGN